jgi:hypothetical protein
MQACLQMAEHERFIQSVFSTSLFFLVLFGFILFFQNPPCGNCALRRLCLRRNV